MLHYRIERQVLPVGSGVKPHIFSTLFCDKAPANWTQWSSLRNFLWQPSDSLMMLPAQPSPTSRILRSIPLLGPHPDWCFRLRLLFENEPESWSAWTIWRFKSNWKEMRFLRFVRSKCLEIHTPKDGSGRVMSWAGPCGLESTPGYRYFQRAFDDLGLLERRFRGDFGMPSGWMIMIYHQTAWFKHQTDRFHWSYPLVM